MSAFKDTQHGVTFIYTNFYDHYKTLTNTSAKGVVLKSAAEAPKPAEVRVVSAQDQNEYSEWVQKKDEGKSALSKSLKELRESRKRFSFLLAEIETLLKHD